MVYSFINPTPPQKNKQKTAFPPHETLQRPIRTKDKAERRFLQWQGFTDGSFGAGKTQQVIPSLPPKLYHVSLESYLRNMPNVAKVGQKKQQTEENGEKPKWQGQCNEDVQGEGQHSVQ